MKMIVPMARPATVSVSQVDPEPTSGQASKASAGTNSSWAGFVQAGYHLSDRWTGYARYEKASLSANDPYFKLMNNGITNYGASYDQKTVGVRYDLDQRSALKFQAERINDAGNPTRVNTWLRAQYAVRF